MMNDEYYAGSVWYVGVTGAEMATRTVCHTLRQGTTVLGWKGTTLEIIVELPVPKLDHSKCLGTQSPERALVSKCKLKRHFIT